MRLINEALRRRKDPVSVAIVGCGWWGSGVALSFRHTPGLHPRVLVDKDIERCVRAFREYGAGNEEILVVESAADLRRAEDHRYVALPEISMLEELPRLGIDVIHEATGEVLAGARCALLSIAAGIPFTTVNSEMDATIGLELARRAAQAGVLYSNADGDQPGCLARMLDDIIGWGFEPRIAGIAKGFLDHYQTPQGVMPWVPAGGNPHMISAAADGAKTGMELSVVANAFNYPPLQRGMHGPTTDKAGLIEAYRRVADLDALDGGHIDFTLGTTEPGMGAPVFVVAYSDDPWLAREMKHYKKGPGPYYLFFRDHHLGSIEARATIAEAALFASAALTPRVWCSEVITMAKRDLRAGARLDEIGGYDYYGVAERANVAATDGLLPAGLACFATLLCDVAKDEPIRYEHVELEDNVALELRRLQDAGLLGAVGAAGAAGATAS